MPRLESFRDAICETVKPGDVVLDLGCGTGILGLLACRAGAKRVYSVEATSIIGLARDISAANRFREKVVFIKALSTRLDLPERVDVVVADQIGRFGFDAGVLEYFTDAKARFLRNGGRLIPSRIDFHVAPVQSDEMRNQIDFWMEPHAELNFTPAFILAANTGYGTKLQIEDLLGEPAKAASVDTSSYDGAAVQLDTTFVISRPGRLDGIGCWFSAQLSDNVMLTNSPLSPRRINRSNVFLPIENAVLVQPGDRVHVQMSLLTHEVMISWKVKVFGQEHVIPKHVFKHSTLKGMLLCHEDLTRTRPDFVPKLNPWGKARTSVVNLCDGKRTIFQIEDEVYSRHSDLFPTRSAASAFVAEVVTRYSL
jgi:SAM-dependent methyltransferase